MPDHSIRLQFSDDGSHNNSDWMEESIGAEGQYSQRAVFTRLGSFYTRTYTIRCSSPRRRDLLGIVANMESTDG